MRRLERVVSARVEGYEKIGVWMYCGHMLTFFFSSKRRHTRFDCDWSSDVCSSDLNRGNESRSGSGRCKRDISPGPLLQAERIPDPGRSEERRVGKEWRSRWSPY